jgi:phosphatidylinositol glycan class H protein
MLLIRRPTSTTVLYTVSTRAQRKTLTAHITAYLFILVRIFIGVLVAAVVFLDYQRSGPAPSQLGALVWLENTLLKSPFGHFAILLINTTGLIYRLLICAALTWLVFRKCYTEESLLVIRGLGVQTSTSSPSYLGTSSTRFIPTSHIQDIFIHEAFKGFEVRFYLSIVVEGEEDVVVVFPVSLSLLIYLTS